MPPSPKFWNKAAKNYAKQPVADEAAYQEKLRITREYFRPDMTVLEFGCGTGSTAISHAPYVGHIQATDISLNMIEIAKAKAKTADVNNVTFKCAPFEELNIPDNSLDAVLGMSILHLMDDWKEAIAKVHNMLKPGGVFISSTTCIGDMAIYFKLIMVAIVVGKPLGLLPLVRMFTAEELQSAITAAGFEIAHRWCPGKNKAVFIVAKK